jgi:hypothetical protein
MSLGIDEMIADLDRNNLNYVFEIGKVKNLLFDTGL